MSSLLFIVMVFINFWVQKSHKRQRLDVIGFHVFVITFYVTLSTELARHVFSLL